MGCGAVTLCATTGVGQGEAERMVRTGRVSHMSMIKYVFLVCLSGMSYWYVFLVCLTGMSYWYVLLVGIAGLLSKRLSQVEDQVGLAGLVEHLVELHAVRMRHLLHRSDLIRAKGSDVGQCKRWENENRGSGGG